MKKSDSDSNFLPIFSRGSMNRRLLTFVGYGNLLAPIWFIGKEEGVGGVSEDETRRNLIIRSNFKPVMDLHSAHRLLREQGQPIDVRQRKSFTSVWYWAARLTAAIRGNGNWRDLEEAKQYIRNRLGRANGETLLTELLPLPSLGEHVWHYQELFATRKQYERLVRPQRIRMFQRLVTAVKKNRNRSRPVIFIAYGETNYSHYKAIFGHGGWINISGTANPAWAKHERSALILLVPFFGNGQWSHKCAERVVAHLRSRRAIGYLRAR